ncbi:MAG: hypothetical protein PVI01_15370 [Gemmatimonadales bacterium]|jgi:hypothetical protein
MGWIGVDLDGTLAHYESGDGIDAIGEPIEPMVRRVKRWLKEGREVRIVTARVAMPHQRGRQEELIEAWCRKVFDRTLPVTHCKDYGMVELWDDRAVQVRMNTGEPVEIWRRRS